MNEEVVIKVEQVSKKFCLSLKRSLYYGLKDISREVLGLAQQKYLRQKEFWALEDVSFELKRGDCLGLIGRNGAGKSTLLKLLNGLIKPDTGRIEINGQVGGLIALGAGFNPILTGRENVYINGAILGLRHREISDRFDEIVDFAEIKDFIDTPVQNYSSGMQVRLGFAVAAILLNPDVLLLDEVLAVGDARFQSKCINVIKRLSAKGTAIILVSHNMHEILRYCDVGLYLKHGAVASQGSIETVSKTYLQDSEVVPEIASQLAKSESGHVPILDNFFVSEAKAYNSCGEPVEKLSRYQAAHLKVAIHYTDLPSSEVVVELAMDDSQGLLLHKSSQPLTLPTRSGECKLEIVMRELPLVATQVSIGITVWSPNQDTLYGWSRNNRFQVDGAASPGRLDIPVEFSLTSKV